MNDRTNEGALHSKRNYNISPAKHPGDYKSVYRRSLLGCYKSSLLLKASPSLKQVQWQQQHEDRTVGSADPVKMRLQPKITLQDNQPVFEVHCGTTQKRHHGNNTQNNSHKGG